MDRILLGERGNEQGMWISKPGTDVKTAGSTGILLSAGAASLQALTAGTVSNVSDEAETLVTIPSVPYVPLVLLNTFPSMTSYRDEQFIDWYDFHGARYRKVNDTTIAIQAVNGSGYTGSTFTVSYIVFARPAGG